MDATKDIICKQLPNPFGSQLAGIDFEGLEEIRFRIGRPVMLCFHKHHAFLTAEGRLSTADVSEKLTRSDMDMLFAALCHHSVYAHLSELTDGFITLYGGHRVGVAGRCVIKNNAISNITAISGLNIRIARAYRGCAASLAATLRRGGGICNTLLIAPPQCGKTTTLRDLARIFGAGLKITIIDERSEIAGCCDGMPQFDVGTQTDVLDRFPKARGMLLALRSLSPDIIMTDELGTTADIEALREVSRAGCRLIASVHGTSPKDVEITRPGLLSFFDTAVLLARQNNIPKVTDIISLR